MSDYKLKKINIFKYFIAVCFCFSILFLWGQQTLASTIDANKIIELTNKNRLQNNLDLLVKNKKLEKAAQVRAEDMAQNNYFAHQSPEGDIFTAELQKVYYYYSEAGENLAVNFDNSREIVDAWLKSPSHRQNILNPTYKEIGVGTASGKMNGHPAIVVVQLFGTPSVRQQSSGIILTNGGLDNKSRVLGAYVNASSLKWGGFLDQLIVILISLTSLLTILQYFKKPQSSIILENNFEESSRQLSIFDYLS